MVGLKCIQNSSTMAEPHNSLQNAGNKDILSAALGQSGLIFTETEEDDVQDVFAALAEDAGYSAYVPQSKLRQDVTQKLKGDVKSERSVSNESFENDLDDLMDLISNDIGQYAEPKCTTQSSSNTIPILQSSNLAASSSISNSTFSEVKSSVTPQLDQSIFFKSSLSAFKFDARVSFPPKQNLSIESGGIAGLKSILGNKRYNCISLKIIALFIGILTVIIL